MISVIIPAFNAESHLADAIRSAQQQGIEDLEILVVDDKSRDATEAVARAEAEKDPRITVISSPINGGVSNARNLGLAAAKGPYLAFLDADDLWDPQFLSRSLDILKKNNHLAAVFTWSVNVRYSDGKRVSVNRPGRGDYDFYRMFANLSPPGNGSSLVLRKSCFDEVGPFLTAYKVGSDTEMWIRILSRSTRKIFRCLPDMMVTRRLRHESLSSFPFDLNRQAAWDYRLATYLPLLTKAQQLRVISRYLDSARRYGPSAAPWIRLWVEKARARSFWTWLRSSPAWAVLTLLPAERIVAPLGDTVALRERLGGLRRATRLRSAWARWRLKDVLRSTRPLSTQRAEAAFDDLQRRFPPHNTYKYDYDSLHQRGRQRAQSMVSRINAAERPATTLEIGAGDGLVSYYLSRLGHRASLCDTKDWRVVAARGLPFVAADVCDHLPFPDETFDAVVSFNALEHLSDPARALAEMVRVCVPGGRIYLDFNPLYCSPWGLHAYHFFHMPYPQFLFSEPFLARRILQAKPEAEGYRAVVGGGTPVPVNGWRLGQYDDAFRSSGCEILSLTKECNDAHLDVIRAYPEAFAGRNLSAEDLIVSGIRALLRKPL